MKHLTLILLFFIYIPVTTHATSLETYQIQITNIDLAIAKLQVEKQAILKQIPTSKQNYSPDKTWQDPLLGINFVWIEGGCFKMGDRLNVGDDDEKPSHDVCIDGYYMGTYEITQAQYVKVMRKNPSSVQSTYKPYPVESVSWPSVQNFIKKLNKYSKVTFRLPTEAEWEYAARSGNERYRYAGSDNANFVAWGQHNDAGVIKEIGQKKPNTLGLYDMSGNVAEWCSDWYQPNYYKSKETSNPIGPQNGQKKVVRGGSYKAFTYQLRIANRSALNPQNRLDSVGFRLAYTP